MEKVIIRGCILLSVFLGSWFLLQQVNWIGFFNINPLLRNEYVNKIEVELGELMYDDFTSRYSVVNDDLAVATIDTIVTKICEANNINRKELKVYLLESEEVNAFALPNHQLMIYTGLAKKTSTPEAFAGVIGHELAHIQKDHVMQSLVREIGLGTLFTIISGGDFSMVSEIGRMVSSTAFSRNLEKEADLVGLTYIQNAQIDPKPFAEFIGVIHDDKDKDLPSVFKWVSTHPFPEDRKEYLLQNIQKEKREYKPVLSADTWKNFQEFLKD